MRPLLTEGGVVAVAGIDDGVVAVDIEQPTRHIAEEFLERAGLPGLTHPAGEQAVTGNRSGFLKNRPE